MNEPIPLPQPEIRPATAADRDRVLALVTAIWPEVYAGHVPQANDAGWRQEQVAALIEAPDPGGWVAARGPRIDGYCSISGNCVEQIWVDARMRRRGLGRSLIERALDAMRARDYAFAQAGCEDFNTGAWRFLETLGWKTIASEPLTLGEGRRCQALVLSRPLRTSTD